jgi:DNA-binding Lrp family transcriptional regulator
MVNLAPAGYIYSGIYFSTALTKKQRVSSLLKSLYSLPEIVWFAEIGGAFQYGLAFCVPSIFDSYALLEGLAREHPGLFRRKTHVIQVSMTRFNRRYFSSFESKNAAISMSAKSEGYVLDEDDRAILSNITEGNWSSYRELARSIDMPIATMNARLERLRTRGILAGDTYDINVSALGVTTQKLLIFTDGLDPEFAQALGSFSASHRNVTQMYQCLGDWDFELNVEVFLPSDVTTLIGELYDRFGDRIRAIEVITKYRDLKISHVPFLARRARHSKLPLQPSIGQL